MTKDLKSLLLDELHDIFSAEMQILKVLPKMVTAAESPDLKKALSTHLQETKGQVQRLNQVFKLLKTPKKAKFCHGMKGLIEEGNEVMKEFKTKSSVRDAALISKAQRIEHYEISAYGTARTYAKELSLSHVADLLQATLDEEAHADTKLTSLAEGGILRTGINILANKPVAVKPTPKKPRAVKRVTKTAIKRTTLKKKKTSR